MRLPRDDMGPSMRAFPIEAIKRHNSMIQSISRISKRMDTLES